MSLFDRLPHIVDILGPPTEGRDAAGGRTLTYGTTRASNVPCLIQAPTDAEQNRFDQRNLVGTYQLAFQGTVTISRGDDLSVVSADVLPASTKLRITGLKYQPTVGGIAGFLIASAERLE